MPFKFAALDDAIVASKGQATIKADSEEAKFLLSVGDPQGRRTAPLIGAKTPLVLNPATQHVTPQDGALNLRPRHGVSDISPLSGPFDASRGESNTYYGMHSTEDALEYSQNPYILAQSLDRPRGVRSNMMKVINQIDMNRAMPVTVSRSFGYVRSQKGAASTHPNPSVPNPSFHVTTGEFQLPQSQVVHEHLRSGHISSHTGAGTAAVGSLTSQKHAIQISLQLPTPQIVSAPSFKSTQNPSPRYISKQAFPGSVLDRAMRTRMTNQSAVQRRSPKEQEQRKIRQIKMQYGSSRKGRPTAQQLTNTLAAEESSQVAQQSENAKIQQEIGHFMGGDSAQEDGKTETETAAVENGTAENGGTNIDEGTLEVHDLHLTGPVLTEFPANQIATFMPGVNLYPIEKSRSPPMRIDELGTRSQPATPPEKSNNDEDEACMSPAFKTITRARKPFVPPEEPTGSGLLEPNKSSTALKMSSVVDLSPCRSVTQGSPLKRGVNTRASKAATQSISSAKQSVSSKKGSTKGPEQPASPTARKSTLKKTSTLSVKESITSSGSDFIESGMPYVDTVVAASSIVSTLSMDAHRNATNPSSLRSFYCNPSSVALPNIEPTSEIVGESVPRGVAQTPMSVKELLRHKYGPDGLISKRTCNTVDPVVDLDASGASRPSSMAPIIDLTVAKDGSVIESMVLSTEKSKHMSLSDSCVTAKRRNSEGDYIVWSEQTRFTVGQAGEIMHSANGEQAYQPCFMPSNNQYRELAPRPYNKARRLNMRPGPTPLRQRPPDSAPGQIVLTEGTDQTISSFISAEVLDGDNAHDMEPAPTVASDPETCVIIINTTTLSSIFSSPARADPQAALQLAHERFSIAGAAIPIASTILSARTLVHRRSASAPCALVRRHIVNLLEQSRHVLHRQLAEESPERVSLFYGASEFQPINPKKLERIRMEKPRTVAGPREDIEKCIVRLQSRTKEKHAEGDGTTKGKSFSFYPSDSFAAGTSFPGASI